MSNAIKWISAEAKKLRHKHPGRKWATYIKEASALYRKGHRAASSVAKKVKRVVKRRRISAVNTLSRSHTDKNKITANIQVGKARRKKIGYRGPITRRVVGSVRKFKSKARPGEYPPPIAWHVVKLHNMGFEKKAKGYVTISSAYPRRIVWQDWEAKQAKDYLKKHCIKSK
jgi:hypothetical protein